MACGCESITYSRDPGLDFSRYRIARVDVNDGDADYTDYLIGELRDGSGFKRVIRADEGFADLFIDVQLDVEYAEPTSEDDATVAEGNANYTASDNYGRAILSGSVSARSYIDFTEAAEDTLDEVALVFLAPYKI